MSAVMTSVGIPLTAIPIIAGADRFNDMAQTMTNVAGDLFASTLVAKSEGMIGDEAMKNNLVESTGFHDQVAE
ncbi:MAG: sodium:dicarboxylate symporter [uncultured bacterium]|nr:MAG: sodium:dicarboxylate symporter [uncultured bacterium]